jgi:hypothetical protein
MTTANDILKRVRHAINPAMDVFQGLNEAIHVVTKRLYQLESMLAIDQLAIDVSEDDTYGDLPSDFWGLVSNSFPYLSGYTWFLKPLPSLAVKLSYTGNGIPSYYEIKNTKIYITPSAGDDYTIVGDYFVKPTTISATTATIPYNELFDDFISNYLKLYFQTPPGGVVSVPQNWLDQIDLVATKREKKAPFHTNTNGMGISWQRYM